MSTGRDRIDHLDLSKSSLQCYLLVSSNATRSTTEIDQGWDLRFLISREVEMRKLIRSHAVWSRGPITDR